MDEENKKTTVLDNLKETVPHQIADAKEAVEESKKRGILGKIIEFFSKKKKVSGTAEDVAKVTGSNPSVPEGTSAPMPTGRQVTGESAGADGKVSPDGKTQTKEEESGPIEVKADDVQKLSGEIDLEEAKEAEFDEKNLTKEEKKELLEEEKIFQQGIASVKDLIAPTSMNISATSLQIGDIWTKSFYVYAYPRFLETNWMAPVVNFDVTMDVSMFIYPHESAKVMKMLRKKVAQFRSTMRMDRQKGIVEDPALETALEDAEQLRRDLQRGTEKFFQFGLYFTIYAENKEKLDKASKQLENIMGGQMVLTKRADMQMEHALTSCLPYCMDELEMTNNMNTGPLSSTFPFTSADLTSNTGILYGLNRHNDSLIIFDRFELENANSVILAKSGAGKSYTVKLEVLRSMMMGTDVIIVDPENEYQTLCEAVGGTFIRTSLSSHERLNPFDLPLPSADSVEEHGDRLRENVIALSGLLKLIFGQITDGEEALIDKALLDTYASKGITMTTEHPETMEPPTMEDLHSVLTGTKGAEALAQRIEKYVTGTYAGIFNQPTNVDLASGLVVFSIRDLEEQLRPIASYVILNWIWNKIRSQLKRRLLIVDEAWIMMQNEDSAKFLYGMSKRARKYYLGVTTITQDVEDFVKSPYGKPIISNSSMQLLMKQSPASIEPLMKLFNLTEGEKYLLLNSGVGQGLFFAGNKHVAIQIIASYGENKVCTTNPEELLKSDVEAEKTSGEKVEAELRV